MDTELRYSILVVEDSDEDYQTLKRLTKELARPYTLVQCSRGDDVLDILYQRGKFLSHPHPQPWPPALVILDLNIIGLDGKTVLCQLKQDSYVKHIPVIVYTTSSLPEDIAFCYQHGANSYMIKPVQIEDLRKQIYGLFEYWFQIIQLPLE